MPERARIITYDIIRSPSNKPPSLPESQVILEKYLGYNERQIIEMARSGDENAFNWIYITYYPRVYLYALARTGNALVSEDLTQDTFYSTYQSLSTFKGQHKRPFSAWVFKIAHNKIVTFYRRPQNDANRNLLMSDILPKKDKPLDGDVGSFTVGDIVSSPDFSEDVGERLDDHSNMVIAVRVLRQMSLLSREVVSLRFFAGLSIAETARILNKKEENIKNIQHKAIMKLRKALGVTAKVKAAYNKGGLPSLSQS